MPQKDPPPTVSFTIPVVKDSRATHYKTVHVVVVTRKAEREDADSEVILPMVIVIVIIILIAGTILSFLSRIKSGPKTERILNRLERASDLVDREIESGGL